MAKNKGSRQAVLLLLVVGVIALLVYQQPGQKASVSQPPIGGFTPPPPSGVYTGPVKANVAHFDALDIATARTEATNVATTWFTATGDQYVSRVSGSGNTFELISTDRGLVYMQTEAKSGQAYYLDIQQTRSKNPRIKDYKFFDIDKDGTKEHVFTVYAGDLGDLKGGETAKPFDVTAFWYADEDIALSAPADISSIGTTANTVKNIGWEATFTNTKKARLLITAEVKFNSTNTNKWSESDSKLTVAGNDGNTAFTIPLSSFTRSQDGTSSIYTYDFTPKDLSGGHLLSLSADGLNKFSFNMKVSWSLASGDKIKSDLTLTALTSAAATASDTDSVLNSA